LVFFGIPDQQQNGFIDLKGNSWGFGFNAGLLYEFSINTRVGVAYRSAIDQDVEGDADFKNVPPALRSSFHDDNVEADITFPDSLSVSFFHQINPQWMLCRYYLTDWKTSRTWWSNSILRLQTTTENWQDSYRYRLATYIPMK
jgi:long-chain fatty acid transport protein